MKMSISNIAWGNKNFEDFLKLIKSNGCDSIELAPSLIWNEPINSDKKSLQSLKNLLKNHDIKMVGFHSLLFNRPDLKFFKDKESRLKTIEYLKKLSELCQELGGSQIVLGSPANRALSGRSYESCVQQILEDFNLIADKCKKNEIYFCIEPLSKSMSDFITSSSEAGEIIKEINHENLKLHLDTKTIFENKEDLESIFDKYHDQIQHFHISELGLIEIGKSKNNHMSIAECLRKKNYKKFVSIEMKKTDMATIVSSINFVKNHYLQ